MSPGKGKGTFSNPVRHRQTHYPAKIPESISHEYGPALAEGSGTQQHWEPVHQGVRGLLTLIELFRL